MRTVPTMASDAVGLLFSPACVSIYRRLSANGRTWGTILWTGLARKFPAWNERGTLSDVHHASKLPICRKVHNMGIICSRKGKGGHVVLWAKLAYTYMQLVIGSCTAGAKSGFHNRGQASWAFIITRVMNWLALHVCMYSLPAEDHFTDTLLIRLQFFSPSLFCDTRALGQELVRTSNYEGQWREHKELLLQLSGLDNGAARRT